MGDYGNVIYEIMNEPEGFGGESGLGPAGRHSRGAGILKAKLKGKKGSKGVSTNSQAGDSSHIDIVAYHVNSPGSIGGRGGGKPIIWSTDGADTMTTKNVGKVMKYANKAIQVGGHFEHVDKTLWDPTWKSSNYDAKLSNVNQGMINALGKVSSGPLR
ncbi:MAG: hypothetical protein H8E17_02995 [Deltaproteobacteria bacterium]|nr:hypothetical protein [Deltaproteobacteria bacterium]